MQDKISYAICQLAQENKNISVGLVKSKLQVRAPLPFITRGVNQYKANPEAFLAANRHLMQPAVAPIEEPKSQAEPENELSDLKTRVVELEQQVAALIEQVTHLHTKSQ